MATSVGIRMTKQIFADTVASAVPILGGALSGGLTYDVKCPVCGVVNHSLLLEETDGWMECEHCGHTAKYCWEPQTKKQIPVFVIRNLQAQVVPADCVHTCR